MLLFPFGTTFVEDAIKESRACLRIRVLLSPLLGQLSFDRRLEDGGPVRLQLGTDLFKDRQTGIEV